MNAKCCFAPTAEVNVSLFEGGKISVSMYLSLSSTGQTTRLHGVQYWCSTPSSLPSRSHAHYDWVLRGAGDYFLSFYEMVCRGTSASCGNAYRIAALQGQHTLRESPSIIWILVLMSRIHLMTTSILIICYLSNALTFVVRCPSLTTGSEELTCHSMAR